MQSGKSVAAELKAMRPEFRAFIMIIPKVPSPHENLDAWIPYLPYPSESIKLKDNSFINGFEIRFLEHDIKYTDEDWGWDYDYVLDDNTTRIKRVFVSQENEIESALAAWLKDLSQLQEPANFNSSLVNSPIESYLDRPDERPHLWK